MARFPIGPVLEHCERHHPGTFERNTMNTRTIAIAALVIAVIILLIIFL
ncbi:MAG TPA: hypothetical protein VFZ64_11200 [Nocardioidaceae bacterium]